jgi:hypothetical protein
MNKEVIMLSVNNTYSCEDSIHFLCLDTKVAHGRVEGFSYGNNGDSNGNGKNQENNIDIDIDT